MNEANGVKFYCNSNAKDAFNLCWWCGEEIPSTINYVSGVYEGNEFHLYMHKECSNAFKQVRGEFEVPMERFTKYGQIRGTYILNDSDSLIGTGYRLGNAWNEFLQAVRLSHLWKWIDDKLNIIMFHRPEKIAEPIGGALTLLNIAYGYIDGGILVSSDGKTSLRDALRTAITDLNNELEEAQMEIARELMEKVGFKSSLKKHQRVLGELLRQKPSTFRAIKTGRGTEIHLFRCVFCGHESEYDPSIAVYNCVNPGVGGKQCPAVQARALRDADTTPDEEAADV